MNPAFLLVSRYEDADAWRRELLALVPGMDFRVWPDCADPGDVTMVAIDYDDISGELLDSFPIFAASSISATGPATCSIIRQCLQASTSSA